MIGQWNQQNSGTSSTLTDVAFLNVDTGLVSGVHNILQTTNGGLTWNKTDFINYFIEGICFSENAEAFAVGKSLTDNKSVILKSIDFGATWSTSFLPSNHLLNSVFFVNDNVGYTVGGSGVAYKTIDGGNNWSLLQTNTNLILHSVYFTDSLKGTIVGGVFGSALILQTLDGGATWTSITSPAINSLQSVFYSSPAIGYCVGWDGQVLKTDNGGISWVLKNTVPNNGDLDVFFINDTVGFIAGGGSPDSSYIKKTTDGGNTWFTHPLNLTYGMSSLFFPSDSIGYCVGTSGTIVKTINGGVLKVESYGMDNSILLYPNPVNDLLHVYIDNQLSNAELFLYDLSGKIYLSKQLTTEDSKINLNDLKPGTYIIQITSDNSIFIEKFLKQ
jgi:photosystem II stability/assembly factor-like uncharacterized protein